MNFKTLLTTLSLLSTTNLVFADQIFRGVTKLEGFCTQTQNNQKQKLIQFVLIQDPRGGVESKSEFVPGVNARVTVEYESTNFPNFPVKLYNARFLLHSFNGDVAVLKSSKKFEFLDHDQEITASFQPESGVQIDCVAQALNVK